MPKTYEIAPHEVAERANRIIEEHHLDIAHFGVRIDYIFARSDNGPAVVHHGVQALAVCRIVNLKDRAKKLGDAEITIDAALYEHMSDEQKTALLDHELHHIIVQRDKEGYVKYDDLQRPMLKMRKHDYDLGWFTVIARRHGMNSPEVFQAKILWDNDGQAYFPMLTGGEERKLKPAKTKAA